MAQSFRFTGIGFSFGWLYRVLFTLTDSAVPLTLHQIKIRCGVVDTLGAQALQCCVDQFVAQEWIHCAVSSGVDAVPLYHVEAPWLHDTPFPQEAL